MENLKGTKFVVWQDQVFEADESELVNLVRYGEWEQIVNIKDVRPATEKEIKSYHDYGLKK